MSSRSALAEALDGLRGVLAARGLRWYLFGAQAASVYGSPRLTADIDVTVGMDLTDAGSLVADLRGHGIDVRVDDIDRFLARTRVLPLTHVATGIPIDVVVAGPGLEEEFLDRARIVDFEGVPVPLIAPEDLIVTKVLAGRDKDRQDVLGILRERLDELDVELVRRTLALLDDALDRGDLVKEFDQALSDANSP